MEYERATRFDANTYHDWILAAELMGVKLDQRLLDSRPPRLCRVLTGEAHNRSINLEEIEKEVEKLGSQAVRYLLVETSIDRNNLVADSLQESVLSRGNSPLIAMVLEKGTLEDYDTLYASIADEDVLWNLLSVILNNREFDAGFLLVDKEKLIPHMIKRGHLKREHISISLDYEVQTKYFTQDLPYDMESVLDAIECRLRHPRDWQGATIKYLLPLLERDDVRYLECVGYILANDPRIEGKSVEPGFVEAILNEHKVTQDELRIVIPYYIYCAHLDPETVRQLFRVAKRWADKTIHLLLGVYPGGDIFNALRAILEVSKGSLNLEDYSFPLSLAATEYNYNHMIDEYILILEYKHLLLINGMEPVLALKGSPSLHYDLDLSLAYELVKTRSMEILEGENVSAARSLKKMTGELASAFLQVGPIVPHLPIDTIMMYTLGRREVRSLSGTHDNSYDSMKRAFY